MYEASKISSLQKYMFLHEYHSVRLRIFIPLAPSIFGGMNAPPLLLDCHSSLLY